MIKSRKKRVTKLEEVLKKEIYDSGVQLNRIAFTIDDHLWKLHSENEHRIMLLDTRKKIMKIVNKLFDAGLMK